MKQDKLDAATEEINSARNPIEKEMLLQKYGMVNPKLTEWEQAIVNLDVCSTLGWSVVDTD